MMSKSQEVFQKSSWNYRAIKIDAQIINDRYIWINPGVIKGKVDEPAMRHKDI